MSAAKQMYKFGYESQARAMNGFAAVFERPDFQERYCRLVRGLPANSVTVVNQILDRLRVVVSLKDGEEADLYTEEELEAFAEAKEILHDRIVRLSPVVYVWDGYALPIRHFEPNVFLDGYGFRFIEGIDRIGDRAIVDAGAFIGDSTLFLSPLTTGQVFAFEPMLENFRHLETTVCLNGLRNVVPVRNALGDATGELTMTVGNAGACATAVNKIPGESQRLETVGVVTLDDFVRERDIKVGLIKTDVEGAEQMLLRGAKETICRDRPILLISIYHNASDFLDIKPMIESWNAGYRFRVYHPPIKSISGETVLIAEPRENEPRTRAVRELEMLRLDTPNRRAFQAWAQQLMASERIDTLRVRLKETQEAVDRRNKWLERGRAVEEGQKAEILGLKVKVKELGEAVDRRNEWLSRAQAVEESQKAEILGLKVKVKELGEAVDRRNEWLSDQKDIADRHRCEIDTLKQKLRKIDNIIARHGM